MGKSASTPPPPNYVGAAQATAQGNIAAAQAQSGLAKNNVVNPYGSQTWSTTPTATPTAAPATPTAGAPGTTNIGNPPASSYASSLGPDLGFGLGGSANGYSGYGSTGSYGGTSVPASTAPGYYTQTTSLSPQQQALFEGSQGLQSGLTASALNDQNQFTNLIQQGIPTSGLPGIVNSVPGTNLNTTAPNAGTQQTAINSSGVTPLNQTGYQSSLNLSGIPGYNPQQVGSSLDYSNLTGQMPTSSGINQQAEQAALNTQLQTLNPQIAQSQEALKSQLASQGIQPGSAAWNTEMNNLSTSNNQAMNLAQNTALTTGAQIGSQEYQNQLAGYNTLLGQDVNQGNYGLAAQSGNNAANLGAQQEAANLLTTQGQFQNSAANNANAANLAANNQTYSQALANTGLSNTANTQQLQNQLASLGFGNSAQTQQMANALQGAGLTNSAQQQGFSQAAQQQGTQYQQLGGLIQGASNYTMPNFGSGTTPTQSIAGPDYTGAAQGAYNAALNSSNAQNAANNATTSGVTSLAAMAAMVYF